jgi:formamidopyrimidine-DNA glycosylase
VPELPEVETVRIGLNEATCGKAIADTEVLLNRTVAHPSLSQFQAGLQGTQILTWKRRGKYLLAHLVRSGSKVAQPSTDDGSAFMDARLSATFKTHPRSTAV